MGRPQTVTHKQKVQKHSTSLSTYVWNIKEKDDATPTLKWSILRHAKSYSANARNCPLCVQEKFEILFYQTKAEILNKRSELITKCRHINKFMLANYKSGDWTALELPLGITFTYFIIALAISFVICYSNVYDLLVSKCIKFCWLQLYSWRVSK